MCQLFNVQSGGAYELGLPDATQRGAFFTGIAEVGLAAGWGCAGCSNCTWQHDGSGCFARAVG